MRGLSCPRLHTSHAFHSGMMSPMLEVFTELLGRIELKPPQVPYISNRTGKWITPEEATQPEYWAQQLRQPVRFAAGLARLRVLSAVGGRTGTDPGCPRSSVPE